MFYRFIISTLILLFTISFGYSQDDYQYLIEIKYETPSQQASIQDLGLDIWDYSPGRYLVYANSNDLTRLDKLNLSYSFIAKSKSEIMQRFNALADTTTYHTYDDISSMLYDWSTAYPTLCRVSSIGQSWENRDIYLLEISDNPGIEESEPEICIMALQHSREWISGEVAIGLIEYLLSNYSSNTYIQDLIDNTKIFIMPCYNPDGVVYTHTTDRLWRKNRRVNGGGVYGVDLNRNFPYQWGLTSGGSHDSTSHVYFGPFPFSEPENIAFRDFVLSRNINLFVNLHSYGELIIYPWAYTTTPTSAASTYASLCNEINTRITAVRGNSYTVGQWSIALGYQGSGVTHDWIWGTLNRYSVGIELTPTNDPPGFILPESEIVPITNDALPGLLYAIEWVGQITDLYDWKKY